MSYDYEKAHAAMGAVMDGRRDHDTRDGSDDDWCSLVARGRIVERLDDGTRGRYRLDLAIVETAAAGFADRGFAEGGGAGRGHYSAAFMRH